ncbi:HAD domain-containing protein [Streptomyces solisilvae]|uniref:HAD domain-containing protein n=1 Tax=Streptomyces malaysiensis TaxID=92644 RepID=UPI0036B99B78
MTTAPAPMSPDLPTSVEKPLLLLDVDGPLNPYGAPPHRRPEGYTTHRMRPEGWEGRKPLRVWLKPDHGPALLALPYRLVWCSTWQGQANKYIAPVLGLPELDFVPFPPSPATPEARLYWKTSHVVRWAAGRPFVWTDDETTHYDEEYLAEHHKGFGRILHVSPRLGLRSEDFELLSAYAQDAVTAPHTEG